MRVPLLLLLAAVAGCAQKEALKAYDGPALSDAQVALVKPHIRVSISQIDGDQAKAAPRQALGSKDYEIALLPGAHTAYVGYRFVHGVGERRSVRDERFDFRVEAGRRYVLWAREGASTWRPEITDVTDKPHLFCMHYPRC